MYQDTIPVNKLKLIYFQERTFLMFRYENDYFLQVRVRKRLRSGLKMMKIHSVKGDNSFICQENLMEKC